MLSGLFVHRMAILSFTNRDSFFTNEPLVIFGSTGLLGSEFTFYAAMARFSKKFILHGSDEGRLQGLKDELEESALGEIDFTITTSVEEAVSHGGYIFYSRSTRAKLQSRESMLMGNAPMAKELGEAIRLAEAPIKRVVCVSNPSDLMGLSILIHSELSPEKVISLSALDTTRFRRALARILGGSPEEYPSAITLGSHDMKMAPMLGNVRHEGKRLVDILSTEEQEQILKEVMYAGTVIYKLRGHTAYQSPAVLSLMMMMGSDAQPFILPAARYHHSDRYPYVFGAFPTLIDDSGCKHIEVTCTQEDAERLDGAFGSIALMRDKLIQENLLPSTDKWGEELQNKENLVHIIDE